MNQPARQLSRYGWRPADPPRRPVLFVNPPSLPQRRQGAFLKRASAHSRTVAPFS